MVDEAMHKADVFRFADEYPRTLSRGDQQRIAIASALAMHTEYIVLDEPTSGQDGREKKRLSALMSQMREAGITVILVTHDMDIVAGQCTRVIVIADHHVAFDGTPDVLFSEGRPEEWGLAYPASVRMGRSLPGAPYCKDMATFCEMYRKARGSDDETAGTDYKNTADRRYCRVGSGPSPSAVAGDSDGGGTADPACIRSASEEHKSRTHAWDLCLFLGLIEYIGGGEKEECVAAALRMMDMTLLFIYLLGTTRLQDLTASMVQQMKIPYEYAFMFTAGLRFIPDFIEENKAVAEAQACRGLAMEGNFFKKVHRYMSIVRPLMLRSSAGAKPWRFLWSCVDSEALIGHLWTAYRPKARIIFVSFFWH